MTFLLVMVGYYLISKFTFQLFDLVLNAREHEKHIYEFINAGSVTVCGSVTGLEAPVQRRREARQ